LQRADQRAWLGRQYVEAAQNIALSDATKRPGACSAYRWRAYDVLVSLFLAVIAAGRESRLGAATE